MGFKRKFEIGDKVKVIKTNDTRYNQIGEIKHYYSSYDCKGVYNIKFENGTYNYYPSNLEKVEDSSNTDTKSNKLSISDLKPGMKIRIRSDLKEYLSKYMYVNDTISSYSGTVHTIKEINSNNYILLNDIPNTWSIENFSEIVEEPKEETITLEKIKFPLKEGQIVTLLDGKKYQVINNKDLGKCSLCSLGTKGCNDCSICYINGVIGCSRILPTYHYFKLIDSLDSTKKEISINKEAPVKKVGIITKVNFILTDFKSEEIIHSKFTIL